MVLNKTEQNVGAVISFFAIVLVLVYIIFSMLGFANETALLVAMAGNLLFSAALCIFVVRSYRKQGRPSVIDYLNVGAQRYILALFMIMYGIDKLMGNFFDYQLFALDSKLADISEFQLAWFFYGKNPWQELFTGIMEFVPALFLFSRRTYYVACLVLLPVTAQVFILNLFFKIGGVTFPAACILLACNIYILYSQKEKIIAFFRSLNFTPVQVPGGKTNTFIKVLRGIGIFLACFLIFIKIRPVAFRSALQKKYQGLVGVYSLIEERKNGVVCNPGSDSLGYKDLYIEKQNRWNILRRFNNVTDAFILKINMQNDSLGLYINKGGIGDAPDIIDSTTSLKGVYTLAGKILTIRGIQKKDTLQLIYERQDRIRPKKWLW